MSFMKTTTKIASVLGVAGLALSLAACSGGQSVAEACTVANETMLEATDEMQSMLPDALSGETSAADIFKPIDKAFAEAQKKVTNPEVSEALKGVSSEFSKMGEIMGDFKMPDTSDIDFTDPNAMDGLEEMQAQAEEMTKKLEERSSAMEKAGAKLQKLCPAA